MWPVVQNWPNEGFLPSQINNYIGNGLYTGKSFRRWESWQTALLFYYFQCSAPHVKSVSPFHLMLRP